MSAPRDPAADRADRGRPLLVAGGLVLAVLAETSAVGLMGVSGWFIASCAVAGATAASTFSWLAPSGGVRAFALSRIVTNYASRLVLHAAALNRIGTSRLRFFDRIAASDADAAWSGDALDRVLADADAAGMALIRATAPTVVAGAITLVGCAVVFAAGHAVAAVGLALGVALAAVVAGSATRWRTDPAELRRTARAELVAGVDAWAEMASLGAVEALRQRTFERLRAFDVAQRRQAQSESVVTALTGIIAVVTLAVVIAVTAMDGAEVSGLVFVALLAAGVLATSERLPSALDARIDARRAEERLASVGASGDDGGPDVIAGPNEGSAFRATFDGRDLRVRGYRLPESPARSARYLETDVARGQTLFVTGASGSGKTTLVNAIATSLRSLGNTPTDPVVTAVLADDYTFSGTVGSNIRLASPAVSDAELRDLLAAMGLDRAGIEAATSVGEGGRDLSGGEQRRLHIARALATRPDVLLIDEPTTGLDADTAASVLDAIRRQLPDAVILLAMHKAPTGAAGLGPAVSELSLDSGVDHRAA